MMQLYTWKITPQSGFATPLIGDTLFGQMCWFIRYRFGEARLTDLLKGYTENQPFMVVSDAFPSGKLPKPTLPMSCFNEVKGVDRKALKKRQWIAAEDLATPLNDWLGKAQASSQLKHSVQVHNQINRHTSTTGEGFAPFAVEQFYYDTDTELDVYITFDDGRISVDELTEVLSDIGAFGYGKDATTGLGKFIVKPPSAAATLKTHQDANAYLTLAPVAMQGMHCDTKHTYYELFTRLGRLGAQAVVESGKPFKAPILMAKTAAMIKHPVATEVTYLGKGLGGEGSLSKAFAHIVHQGYAPVVPIYFSTEA